MRHHNFFFLGKRRGMHTQNENEITIRNKKPTKQKKEK